MGKPSLFYTGGRGIREDGILGYHWSDDTNMTYQSWAPGQPDEGASTCIRAGYDFWDGKCNYQLSFICKVGMLHAF